MIIGIPKEILNNENRVAITPDGVEKLKGQGHTVRIQTQAGVGSGFSDEEYSKAGAEIVDTAKEAWQAELVMKVKEPQKEEFEYFYEGLAIFTYFHLAPERELTKALLDNKVTAIAYETMDLHGTRPLLTPMSEVAGRMAVQIGTSYLLKPYGGKGVLLGGVTGVTKGKVTVIGGGVSGGMAVRTALGLGAEVTVLDVNRERLTELSSMFQAYENDFTTLLSTPKNIQKAISDADLVIGAVLLPGGKAPKLVTEEMVKGMEKGSVIIDIAIDQGGIFETVDHIGSLEKPTYVKHDVLHYAVPNMPGAVPRTSTIGLTNVSIDYALEIADLGVVEAAKTNRTILTGINTYQGHLTIKPVAEAQNLPYVHLDELLD